MGYVLFSLSDLLEEYKIEEISKYLNEFKCSKEKDLEYFLRNKACIYETSSLGRTFVFVDAKLLNKQQFSIMAFFTIAQTSYDISKMSKKKRRKILGSAVPGRDGLTSFPAFLIGQLGRADIYSGTELPGYKILHECYLRLKDVNKYLGGEHGILECREHMFDCFYKNQGFKKIEEKASDTGLVTLYNRIKFDEIMIE